MSREVKRVPIEFDWPLNKEWEGYLLPDRLKGTHCPDCDGSGQTHFGWWLQSLGYLIGMLATDVRDQEQGKPMHPYFSEVPNPHGHWEYARGLTWVQGHELTQPERRDSRSRFVIDRPGRDALTFFAALTGEPEEKLGYMFGGVDVHYVAMRKLLERAGTDVSCKRCEGHGTLEAYEGQRADEEAWERSEPPAGDGWQLWEGVSAGSPITPVFATPEALAHHMVLNRWLSNREPMAPSFEVAMAFISSGWADSAGQFGPGQTLKPEAPR